MTNSVTEKVDCPTCGKSANRFFVQQAGECTACVMAPDIEREKIENKRCADLLEKVRSELSAVDCQSLDDLLEDGDYTYNFQIVSEVSGEAQGDTSFSRGDYFVDQTTNGGISGDEYAGKVFVPISASEYFSFEYSM